MKSFFFIPGNHPRMVEKIESIQADHLIIDLEDSVGKADLESSIKNVSKIDNKEDLWVRPGLFINGVFQPVVLNALLEVGFRKFVIPKTRNLNDIREVEGLTKGIGCQNVSIIMLVENSECLHNLPEIIKKTKLKPFGIGFGSQDFCAETGIKHSSEYLRYPRFIISNTAKAMGLNCIDIACMDLQGGDVFIEELQEAFNLGYDGKFIIHPKQLECLRSFPFYDANQVQEAKTILEEHQKLGSPAVFVYKGRAIEPPHVNYYKRIINWSKKYGKKQTG